MPTYVFETSNADDLKFKLTLVSSVNFSTPETRIRMADVA